MTKPLHCLVIEYDESMIELYKAGDNCLDVLFLLAKSEDEAIKILSENKRIDVVWINLEIGSIAFIKQIHTISPLTLIITTSSELAVPPPGNFDHLPKPLTGDQLTKSINRAVNKIKNSTDYQVTDISKLYLTPLMQKDFKPLKLLEQALDIAITTSKGTGGMIYVPNDQGHWLPYCSKNIVNENIHNIIPIITQDIDKWKNSNQNNDYKIGSVFQFDNIGQVITIPFFQFDEIIAILVVTVGTQAVDDHLVGILTTFCSQMSGTVKIMRILHEYDDLKKTYREMLQSTKLAYIGELAAEIAHDINTPLTCIVGFIGLFLRFLEKPDVTIEELLEVKRYLVNANEEAKRCKDTLNNLLMFSRKESDQFNKFSIAEVIKRLCTLVEGQLEKANVKLSVEIPENPPSVTGIPNKIQQVLMNLVINAKNATAAGGNIVISVFELTNNVEVVVSDTGSGIKPENLKKIFEPFYTTSSQEGKGTGLGLSISKKIIEEHGGSIKVESVLDKGTTFTVILPL